MRKTVLVIASILTFFGFGPLWLAILSYCVCSILQASKPPAGVDIGLGFVYVTAMWAGITAIPCFALWSVYYYGDWDEARNIQKPNHSQNLS